MRRGVLILLVVVAVFVFAGLFIYGSFVSAQHQLVAKDENVKAAWSQVDIQLQRRADLIPNLVETVKGFTKEESTVFGDIANARAGLLNAHTPSEKIQANGTAGLGLRAAARTDRKLPATALERSVHAAAG